ncbi:MAG: 30S ribosomal protein S5 [Rubritalea sp.]|uniref:30S ribosomal protein S5 n=1 Tax=Rubritalea sp. TaxID=2109375 RepID=UPI0032425F37
MSENKENAAATPVASSGAPSQGRGGPGGRGQGGRGGKGGRRERPQRQAPPKPTTDDGVELVEKVVFINRCAKVVKGGRRFSFSALMVSGTHEGRVGVGYGKANEVIDCIKKAAEDAKRRIKRYAIVDGTIPHEVYAEFGGGKVLLKPACPGTGVIAGGGVRAVCEAVGIQNVLGKSLGSNNHANVVKATVAALAQLRTRDDVLGSRGKLKSKSL